MNLLGAWICKKCGTINEDFYAHLEKLPYDMADKLMQERMEVEKRGEIPKEYCVRCKGERP